MEPPKKSILYKFFGGSKNAVKILLVILAAGVALLALPRLFLNEEREAEPQIYSGYRQRTEARYSPDSEETALERRLSEILSLVEGAGRVSVLIYHSRGYERVPARNTTEDFSALTEHDASGGTRDQSQVRQSSTIVTLNRREGGDEPLILYEAAPRIEGVLIVAEGGGNVFVRDALTRAASGLLGVAIHNITVLPMANK